MASSLTTPLYYGLSGARKRRPSLSRRSRRLPSRHKLEYGDLGRRPKPQRWPERPQTAPDRHGHRAIPLQARPIRKQRWTDECQREELAAAVRVPSEREIEAKAASLGDALGLVGEQM